MRSYSLSSSARSCVTTGLMRSRMAGRSFLYCSPSFTVATRLFAAVIASGDGVCADAEKVIQRKLPTTINERLHMENPTEGNCRLLNSNLRPCCSFFGAERGLGGLCHADKQVGHFRRAAQKPGYADHDQNAGGANGKLLPDTFGVLSQDPMRGKR